MKQFTELIAKRDFTMGFAGRKQMKVKAGDLFLVTSPAHNNLQTVKIMRSKNARLNDGYCITLQQLNELFTVKS